MLSCVCFERADGLGRWENNESVMNISCSAVFNETDNTAAENEYILDAIGQESQKSGVDKRFILAIIVNHSIST
jgi:hypothetical protein